MAKKKYDWLTQIKPWIEESHPRLWSEWKRAKTKSDKVVVQNDARIAYGQFARLSDPEKKAAHAKGQSIKFAKDPEYRAAHKLQTKKSQFIGDAKGGLSGRVIPRLEEFGTKEDVKSAKKMLDKFKVRGYRLTPDDITNFYSLSDKADELKASQTQRRLRAPYGKTEGELKSLYKEVWGYEENKRIFNQRLEQLEKSGVIDKQQFNKYRLSPGHGFSHKGFPEFSADLNNIHAETLKHNRAAGIKMTGAQVVDQMKAILTDRGLGIDADTRSKLNQFGQLAEKNRFNPNFIYTSSKSGKQTMSNMDDLLRYFTGYGVEGEYGLAGKRVIDPLKKRERIPVEGQRRVASQALEGAKSGLMTWGKRALSKAPIVGTLLSPSIAKAYWDEGEKGKAISSLLGVAGIVPEFLFDWEKMGKGFRKTQEEIDVRRRKAQAEIDARRRNFQSTWRGGNNIWNQ